MGAESSPTLYLSKERIGLMFKAKASYMDESDIVKYVESSPTAAVVNKPDALEGELSLEGSEESGETITVNTSALVDKDDISSMLYQWYLVNDLGDAEAIQGKTSATLLITDAFAGKFLRAVVTVVDKYNVSESRVATSVGKAKAAVPGAPTDLVPTAGSTFAHLEWEPSTGLVRGYRVYKNGELLATTTSTFYTASGLSNDVAYAFSVEAFNADKTSALSAVVNVTPRNTLAVGTVSIVGIVREGEALTAQVSNLADADGLPDDEDAFTYEWLASSSRTSGYDVLQGETSSSLALGPELVGKYIKARLSFTDQKGTAEELVSVPSEIVYGPPSEPFDVTVSYDDGSKSASVSWSAPTYGGFNPIQSYRVRRSDGREVVVSGSGLLTVQSTDLAYGQEYYWTVSASNGLVSAFSEPSRTVLVYGKASIELSGAVEYVPGQDSLSLAWSLLDNGGKNVESYSVTVTKHASDAGEAGSTSTVSTSALTYTAEGLEFGRSYTFSVVANNGLESEPVTYSALAYEAPDSPSQVSLQYVPGETQGVLTWSAGASNGGKTVTKYRIARNGAIVAEDVAGTSLTITGLEYGLEYSYSVEAYNGLWSATSEASTPVRVWKAPHAPFVASTSVKSARILLSWNAPVFSGGKDVEGYKIYIKRAMSQESFVLVKSVDAQATRSAVLTGLTNEVLYTVGFPIA